MCGVAGLLLDAAVQRSASGDADGTTETVRRMINTITHRGPDALAVWGDGTVALGHTRLSIIDLAATGAQPMESGRGCTIAYNGECYNFRELRAELASSGWVFRGHSDTEVVLAAYETWGLDGLRRLEGMFAFALWDSRTRRLLLMRDRLGIKPLYVGRANNGLAFGSEVKAVLAAGGVDCRVDQQALREYLWYGASQDDRTIYRGIRAIPPGHWMICENGRNSVQPWWRIEDWLRPASAASYGDAVDTVRRKLVSAVERQLVADVPVGIFLSGGVDSSAIAAATVAVGARDVMCYTADFGDATQASEVSKATFVARHLGLAITEVRIPPHSLVNTVEALARLHDEPFADAANIPLYLMCQALHGRVKVVLQGDGGDEVFGGYRRYLLLRHAGLWRRMPGHAGAVFARLGGRGRRLARILSALHARSPGIDMALLLAEDTLSSAPERALREDLREHLTRQTDPFLTYRNAALRFAEHDPVQRMLLTDLTVQLPALYFAKVDRATMAHGIESRVPLLDEMLLREAVTFPSEWKVRGLQKKRVLRDALRGQIPERVLDAPKAGFGVPISTWLRTGLRAFAIERLTDPASADVLGFDPASVQRLLAEHQSGSANHGYLLWRLLQLTLWNAYRPSQLHVS